MVGYESDPARRARREGGAHSHSRSQHAAPLFVSPLSVRPTVVCCGRSFVLLSELNAPRAALKEMR